jgi:hypothetical protein
VDNSDPKDRNGIETNGFSDNGINGNGGDVVDGLNNSSNHSANQASEDSAGQLKGITSSQDSNSRSQHVELA